MQGVMIQAKSGEVSSDNHIYNKQDSLNMDESYNKNQNVANILIRYDEKDNNFKSVEFLRNGKNEEMREKQKQKADLLDKEARADYKKHKEAERLKNPGKKIRTELQTKNTKKEFIIGFGDTSRDEILKLGKQKIQQKCLDGALAILKEKKLERKNLIGIAIHLDEMGQPHAHVQYNCYSFKEKTTDTQLEKCLNTDKKKQQYDRLSLFSKYQTIIADVMGLERGLKGSTKQKLSINDIRAKKQQEQAEKALKTLNEAKEQIKVNNETLKNQQKQIDDNYARLNKVVKKMSYAEQTAYKQLKNKDKDLAIK
jgi:hypothetical protein